MSRQSTVQNDPNKLLVNPNTEEVKKEIDSDNKSAHKPEDAAAAGAPKQAENSPPASKSAGDTAAPKPALDLISQLVAKTYFSGSGLGCGTTAALPKKD